MSIREFFNYSKFEVRTTGGNDGAVIADAEYSLTLEVFDAIGLDKPALVSAELYKKIGRDSTHLPTVVGSYPLSGFIHLFQFTVATADWNGEDELVLVITVTDSAAFVYTIHYQVKA